MPTRAAHISFLISVLISDGCLTLYCQTALGRQRNLFQRRWKKSSGKVFNALQLDPKAKLASQQTTCRQPTRCPTFPRLSEQAYPLFQVQITLRAQTSSDGKALRTALTEIERRRNPKFRTPLLHLMRHYPTLLPLSVSRWGLSAPGEVQRLKGRRLKVSQRRHSPNRSLWQHFIKR